MDNKFINGENLVYVLNEFEKRILQEVDNITSIGQANSEDIVNLFSKSNKSNKV